MMLFQMYLPENMAICVEFQGGLSLRGSRLVVSFVNKLSPCRPDCSAIDNITVTMGDFAPRSGDCTLQLGYMVNDCG